jgi:hypothetical protein
MRLPVIAALSLLSIGAYAKEPGRINATCRARVADLQATYDQAVLLNAQKPDGVPKTIVDYVLFQLVAARFECGLSKRNQYCSKALPAFTHYLDTARAEAGVGKITLKDLVDAQNNYWSVKTRCPNHP